MRQKTRMSRRRLRPEKPVGAAGQDPAEWLLVNETGWGMPHSGCATLAAAVVVAKAVAIYLGRRGARPPRPDEPPHR
jgi:hypothetical protein